MVGNSFTHSCGDWRDGTYKNFKEWAVKQFGLKNQDSNDEAEVLVQTMKAKDIAFEKDKNGEYILPDMDNYKTIHQKQRVIHVYIGAVYCTYSHIIGFSFLIQTIGDFTGSSRLSFPYSLAAKDDQIIFSPDCVPEGFRLSDPDHLTALYIKALKIYWWGWQKKGLMPFIVLNASPNQLVARRNLVTWRENAKWNMSRLTWMRRGLREGTISL